MLEFGALNLMFFLPHLLVVIVTAKMRILAQKQIPHCRNSDKTSVYFTSKYKLKPFFKYMDN